MTIRRITHPRRVLALATVAAVAALAISYAGIAGATSAAPPSEQSHAPITQTLHIQSHSIINYDGRRADGITATTKYDQGDSTTDSYWELGPGSTPVQIKNVTTNRDGDVIQEELMSDGIDAVYFAVGPNGAGACIMSGAWDAASAGLPTISTSRLAALGYRVAAPTAADIEAAPSSVGRSTVTLSRVETYPDAPTLRHVAIGDGADGALYADLVWKVNSDATETLSEARTYSRPEVGAFDSTTFTLPAVPACGRTGAAK